jgi:hypothetical protein
MQKEEIEHFVDELAAEKNLPGPTSKPGVFRRWFSKNQDETPSEPTMRDRIIGLQESVGAILDRVGHLSDAVKDQQDAIKKHQAACLAPPPPPTIASFDIAQPGSVKARLLALNEDDAEYLARLAAADIESLKDKLSPAELAWRTEIRNALNGMFGDAR